MKGLVEATDTGTIYLNVKHHSICQESKTERPGFKMIQVENPRTRESVTKYIKQFKGIEALICKIEWYSREHEGTTFRGWKLHLDAAGTPCILDLPFNSRAGNRFMKLAENLDFSQPVEFSAWYDSKSDATAFNVKQNGRSVPQVYTKEGPGDCPPPVQSKLGKWNYDAQEEFLFERMKEVVIPAVEEAGNEMPYGEAVAVGAAASATQSHVQSEPDFSDDDIPF